MAEQAFRHQRDTQDDNSMRNVSNSSSDQCSKGNRLEPRLRKLRQAIIRCRDLFELDEIVFCDGGGDSLILQHGDANSQSETVDPYDGGDAEVSSKECRSSHI